MACCVGVETRSWSTVCWEACDTELKAWNQHRRDVHFLGSTQPVSFVEMVPHAKSPPDAGLRGPCGHSSHREAGCPGSAGLGKAERSRKAQAPSEVATSDHITSCARSYRRGLLHCALLGLRVKVFCKLTMLPELCFQNKELAALTLRMLLLDANVLVVFMPSEECANRGIRRQTVFCLHAPPPALQPRISPFWQIGGLGQGRCKQYPTHSERTSQKARDSFSNQTPPDIQPPGCPSLVTIIRQGLQGPPSTCPNLWTAELHFAPPTNPLKNESPVKTSQQCFAHDGFRNHR